MPKSRVQVQEEIPGTETELSELCDGLLAAREATAVCQKEEDSIEAKIVEYMISSGKKSVKHGGKVFRCSHKEEKNVLQITSAG